MRKTSFYLISTVLLLALFCVGCSSDNPVRSQPTDNSSPIDDGLTGDKTTQYVLIQGWVKEWDGDIPPVGTPVIIQDAYIYVIPWEWATIDDALPKTDKDGYFSWTLFLSDGEYLRCLCLGAITAAQEYNGVSTVMTFYLTGLKPVKDTGVRPRT